MALEIKIIRIGELEQIEEFNKLAEQLGIETLNWFDYGDPTSYQAYFQYELRKIQSEGWELFQIMDACNLVFSKAEMSIKSESKK